MFIHFKAFYADYFIGMTNPGRQTYNTKNIIAYPLNAFIKFVFEKHFPAHLYCLLQLSLT